MLIRAHRFAKQSDEFAFLRAMVAGYGSLTLKIFYYGKRTDLNNALKNAPMFNTARVCKTGLHGC